MAGGGVAGESTAWAVAGPAGSASAQPMVASAGSTGGVVVLRGAMGRTDRRRRCPQLSMTSHLFPLVVADQIGAGLRSRLDAGDLRPNAKLQRGRSQ